MPFRDNKLPHDSKPEIPMRVIFGFQVPEPLIEKAGPFLLGMLTTYVLQLSSPVLLYYFSITAQFVRMALVWLVVSAAICWYTGVITPQTSDLQAWFSNFLSCIPRKQDEPLNSTVPDLSYPAENHQQPGSRSPQIPRSPRSRSPIRTNGVKTVSEVSPVRHQNGQKSHPSFDLKSAREPATINVRPFVAPIREGRHQIQSSPQVPQPMSHPFKLASHDRPDPDRKGSEGSILRAFINPKYLDRPIPDRTPESPSPRRNSRDSSKSEEGSQKSHKSLPQISPDTRQQRSRRNSDRTLDSIPARENVGLARNDSVLSSNSVLGTRANYSKFLANVNEA